MLPGYQGRSCQVFVISLPFFDSTSQPNRLRTFNRARGVADYASMAGCGRYRS